VQSINCSVLNMQPSTDSAIVLTIANCVIAETEFAIDVSFPIYIIGLMSFISWFIFVIFGGIGLAAIPLDLIYDFITRPKSLKKRILVDSVALRELATETNALEIKGAKKKTSIL
jgi:hypothetical protein